MRFLSRFPAALMVAAVVPFFLIATSCGDKGKDKPGNNDKPDTPTQKDAPVIKAQDATVIAKAGTYQIPFSVENPVEGVELQVSFAGEAPSWVSIGQIEGTNVNVTVQNNLAEDRYTNLRLQYQGADPVTVKLTQSKWDYPEFGISVANIGPFGATVTITRKTGYNGGYFFEVLDKEAFSKYVKDDTNNVGDFAYGEALYQSDLAYLQNLANHHGHPLSQLFSMLGSMYSSEAQTSMPYSSLSIDTEYVFIVYGMDATDEARRRTPICLYEFRTGYSSNSELEFSGKATDISETYATITVTPSNNTEYWYMDWVSEIQLQSTTLAEVMQKSINNAKSLLGSYRADQILCHGQEKIQATDLMPGTNYTVVAWGMNLDMAATTEPKAVFTFKTNDYAVVDDCTFTIEPIAIEDMDIKVRVTPTNLNTRYYVAFVAKSIMAGYSNEQAAQRIINMEAQRIDEHYYNVENLSWENLPGLEAGVREIWGRKDEGWTFQPKHDYRIYVFGIDNWGIRSTAVSTIDVTTADAGASNNHFEVTIDSNTWLGLDFTVTPEIDDEYWLTFLAETSDIETYCRNSDGTLNEELLFNWVEEYYEDEITSRACRGTRKLHEHVTPDTDYTLLVFGYAGTYTTRMYEWQFHVPQPPLGKSEADFSYTYELFRGEDLTALNPTLFPAVDFAGDCIMVVRFTVNDKAKHWYFGCWNPIESYQEQGGKYYIMMLDMNPDVPGSAMQDQKVFRNRPWWYGAGENYKWVDKDGEIVNHWPWSLSGWAEDEDGNYGPWHYELLIPVPVPKDTPGLGRYEVGYTEAYPFWETSSGAPMQIFRASDGREIKLK